MTSSVIRRFQITALDLLQKLDNESHPDMRTRQAREAVSLLDAAITRVSTALALPDTFKVEGDYHSALGAIEGELEGTTVVLAHYAKRLEQVPETPLRQLIPIAVTAANNITRFTDQALASAYVAPSPVQAAYNVSDFGVSVDEYLDAEWDQVLTEGKFRVPDDIDIMLRPERALKRLMCMVHPFTAEQKRLMGYTLWEVASLPESVLPNASHWMSMYSGAMRKWESTLKDGCCCRTVEKSVLLSKTHRASPRLVEGGEYVIFSAQTAMVDQEVVLVVVPGNPFMLKTRYTLNSDAYRTIIKEFVEWPEMATEEDESITLSLMVDQVQTALYGAREALESKFGYGDVNALIGLSEGGQVLMRVEACRTRTINMPRAKEDQAYYLIDINAEDRQLFGTRAAMRKRAENTGRSVGFLLSDVDEIHHRTRTTHTYGMGVWWEIPPTALTVDNCLKVAEDFVTNLGWSGDDSMQSMEMRNYLKDRGIPNHETPETTVQEVSQDLQSRIRFMLDDATLHLPEGVKDRLIQLLNELRKSNIKDREQLVSVIPAKLDFIATHHRKDMPVLAFADDNLKSLLHKALPNLQTKISDSLIAAGVRIQIPTTDEVIGMVSMQAQRDLEHYRYSSPFFCVRAAHGDFTSSNRVVGDFYSNGVSAMVRNRDGYLEYELRINDEASRTL